MVRKYSLLLVAFFYSLVCFPQKLVKHKIGTFSFSGYPTVQIPMDYKLYAVVNENDLSYPATSIVAKTMVLSNKEKVQLPESADIVITISNLSVHESPAIIVTNDKNKEDDQPLSYKAKKRKDISFDISVSDTASVLYQDHIQESRNAESQWFTTPLKAEKSIAFRLDNFSLASELNQCSQLVNKKLGCVSLNPINITIFDCKKKRKSIYDYSELNAAASQFEKACDVIRSNEYDTLRFKEQAATCLSTWQKYTDVDYYSTNESLDDRIVAAIYYNLANYYILMKDYETAMIQIDQCEKLAPDFENIKEWSNLVRSWRNLRRTYDKMMKSHEEK